MVATPSRPSRTSACALAMTGIAWCSHSGRYLNRPLPRWKSPIRRGVFWQDQPTRRSRRDMPTSLTCRRWSPGSRAPSARGLLVSSSKSAAPCSASRQIRNHRRYSGGAAGDHGRVRQAYPRCAFLDKYLLCETVGPPRSVSGSARASLREPSNAWRSRLLDATDKRPDLVSLGIVLERPAGSAGGEIVIFGEGGLVCRTLAKVAERLPNPSEWLMQLGDSRAQHRRYLLDCLARLGAADDKAMSLLRELRLLAPGLRPSATGDAYLRATAELIRLPGRPVRFRNLVRSASPG